MCLFTKEKNKNVGLCALYYVYFVTMHHSDNIHGLCMGETLVCVRRMKHTCVHKRNSKSGIDQPGYVGTLSGWDAVNASNSV